MKTCYSDLLAQCHETKTKNLSFNDSEKGDSPSRAFLKAKQWPKGLQLVDPNNELACVSLTLEKICTSSPPPKQDPLMAATTGFVDFSSFSNVFCASCDICVTS